MNKKKIKAKNKQQGNGQHSLPGQPTPLSVTFEELRRRAMESPQLKPFTQDDVDVGRHSKVVDYSNVFILAIVVQVVFREKQFFWLIESMFVAKSSGKYAELNLLTTGQREELKRAKWEALGEEQALERKAVTAMEIRAKNKILWEVPFCESDYEKLDPAFRELMKPECPTCKLVGEELGVGSPPEICDKCGYCLKYHCECKNEKSE